MKRKIWITLALVVLAVLLCCGVASAASSGTCGENVSWTLDDAGTLTISGTGPMEDYYEDSPFGLNDDIHKIVIEKGVTRIGQSAFVACRAVTSVTIPTSVTSIGDSAFDGCSGLTSVTIPNSVTSIGWYAFSDCSGLTSVTIPNSVKSIGVSAFSDCTGLTSVTIPNGVTSVDAFTFQGCSGLTSVTIPNSVTSIDAWAFSGCEGLTSVTIPNSVTSIGTYTFAYCTGLSSVTFTNSDALPSQLSLIHDSAFQNCSSLTEIIIPESVISIENTAFRNCSQLKQVTILNQATVIGSRDLWNVFEQCSENLTIIGYTNSTAATYAENAGIPFITLGYRGSCGDKLYWTFDPDSGELAITGTGKMTDYSIDDLPPWLNYEVTSLNIGSGVTSIGNYAFYECYAIPSITVPYNITSIGSHAFGDIGELTSVFVANVSTKMGDNLFLSTNPDLTLYGYYGSTAQAYAEQAGMPFVCLVPAPTFFLPASLTTIEAEAFNGITAEAVVIPKTVTKIVGNPFENSGVMYIYGYPGTVAENLARSNDIQFVFVPIDDTWMKRNQ